MNDTAATPEAHSGDVCVIPTSRMRRDLLRSHLLVAAIAVGGLLAATGALAWLSSASSRSIEELHLEISCAMQLESDIERSMAELHAWMLTGDDSHKRNRRSAWEAARRSMRDMEQLAAKPGNADENSQSTVLYESLRELNCQQWWIEDMARTPGNHPAEAILVERVDPTAERIFRGITATIDLERVLPASNRRELLADMADFRGFFTRSHAMLAAIVHRTRDASIPNFIETFRVAKDRISRLVDDKSAASQPQLELIALLDQQMLQYQGLSEVIVEVVGSDSRNLAELRYATQAVPLAEKCNRALALMVGAKTRQLKAEQQHMATVSRLVCGAVFVLACSISILAGFLSYRRAKAIADPILTLCEATQNFAEGNLEEDIPVTTNDEVAILTHTFNSMRHALGERTDTLVRSNEELRLMQERFQTLIDFAPVAMVMIDSQQKITLVNGEAENLFGYREADLLGKEIEILLPERFRADHPAKVGGYFQEPETRQMGEALELRGLKKDGAEFPVEVGLRPLPVDGELQVLSAIVDSSKRKAIENLEKQLAQAHRLESIGQLAAGVAHEINSPMQFIDSNVGYLGETLPKVWDTIDQLSELLTRTDLSDDTESRLAEATTLLNERGIEHLRSEIPLAIDECAEGIHRVVEIVQAMKEMSHPGSEDKSPASVNDIVHSAATLTRNRWKQFAEVEFELDDSLPAIHCYPGDLNRVLVNLIVNAADAICDSREESVDPLGRIIIRTRNGLDHVVLEVEDTGGGIPDSVINKIYDPFYTTKEVGRGSGQGLAICYDVVAKRHQGRIECRSTPGVGTTFRITLPLSTASQVTLAAASGSYEI